MNGHSLDRLKTLIDQLAAAVRWEDVHLASDMVAKATELIQSIDPKGLHNYKDVIVTFASLIDVAGWNHESKVAETRWRQCLTHITEMFPADHLLLADIFFVLSSLMANGEHLDEALELCGRGLLVRVKVLGVHEKTAESHFHLGLLYFRKEQYSAALKELVLARCLYVKLSGPLGVQVSDCDMAIGQVEFRLFNTQKSYLAFYQSYRARLQLLGPTHSLTMAAEEMIATLRGSGEDRLFCGRELKDIVVALNWANAVANSFPFAAALFVNRVSDDVVFTAKQTQALLASAHSFCKSRLAAEGKRASMEEDLFTQLCGSAPAVSQVLQPSSPPPPSSLSAAATATSLGVKGKVQPSTSLRTVSAKQAALQITTPTSPSSATKQSPNLSSPTGGAVTWRPIPAGSPLRPSPARQPLSPSSPHASHSTSSARPLSPSAYSAASVGMRGTYQLLREVKEDRLLVVQPSTPRLLRDCLGSKLAAFGLIAWLSEQADLSLGGDGELARRRRSSVHRPLSMRLAEARRRSTMRSQAMASQAAAATASAATAAAEEKAQEEEGGGGSGGARAALGALLSKRFAGPPVAVPPPPPPPSSSSGAAASASKAKEIPVPPPVPTCWPPIPFVAGADGGAGPEKASIGQLFGSVEGGEATPKPSKPKLKQVQLVQLPSVEGTFWAEPQDVLIPASELFDDLEEMFLHGVKKKPIAMHMSSAPKKEAKALPGKAGGASESVLDPQRAQNISIMLAKFGRRSLESIAEAIVQFDAEGLGQSSLSALQQFIPTADEFKKVGAFVLEKAKSKGVEAAAVDCKFLAQSNVGKAEQYIYAMSKVVGMEKRLTTMSAVLGSTETVPAVLQQSDVLVNACAEIRGSGKLKFLLRTFLDLSNLLAAQASLPTSVGFQLPSWRRLSQTKTNNGETVEQYVVGKLLAAVPEVLQVANDFPSLDEGRQVQLTRLQAEVRKLGETLAALDELAAGEPPDSVSAVNLHKHIAALSQLHAKAKQRVGAAQNDFNELAAYFGHPTATSGGGGGGPSGPAIDPETFFVEIKDLCRNMAEQAMASQSKARRRAFRS